MQRYNKLPFFHIPICVCFISAVFCYLFSIEKLQHNFTISGNTLYTTLHLRRDKFSMNKIVIIAQQITNGMGYLHDKGIVHKDLKSKNVFLENGRAIITDFGLVNVARRLCGGKTANKDSKFSFEDHHNR